MRARSLKIILSSAFLLFPYAVSAGQDISKLSAVLRTDNSSLFMVAEQTTLKAANIEDADEIGYALELSSDEIVAHLTLPTGSDLALIDQVYDENGNSYFKVLINGEVQSWFSEEDLLNLKVYSSSASARNGMITPVQGRITSRPGMRKHPTLKRRKMHMGTDIAARSGTPIKAAADGVVSYAGWAGGYGKVVYINHSSGVQTRYAHMSAISVRTGQSVSQGSEVGKVGSTGRSTGPHLHFEERAG